MVVGVGVVGDICSNVTFDVGFIGYSKFRQLSLGCVIEGVDVGDIYNNVSFDVGFII